jgi:hypothetical protein
MPTYAENLRRSAYQRPWMKNYRGGIGSGSRFGGDDGLAQQDSYLEPGWMNPSVDYYSESTPGVKYKSFEEALAVGKEARELQDMEDYRRFTAATGLPETKEGYVGYRKEKGAQREVEKQKADKNAAIARQQFEKDRAFRASRLDRAIANRQARQQQANYNYRTAATARGRQLDRLADEKGRRRTSQRTAKTDFLKQFHSEVAKGSIPADEVPMHLKGMGINPGELDYYQAMGAAAAHTEDVRDVDIASRVQAVRDIIKSGDLRPLNRIDTTEIPYNSQEVLHSEIQTARSNIINDRELAVALKGAWEKEKESHEDGRFIDPSEKEEAYDSFIKANGAAAVMMGSYDHPVFVAPAEGLEGKSLEEVSPFSPWISPMPDSGVDESGYLTSPIDKDSYDVDLPPGSTPLTTEEGNVPIPEGVPLSDEEAAIRAEAEADYQAFMEDARIRRVQRQENPHVEGYVKSLQEVPNKFSEALVGAWEQAKGRYEDHKHREWQKAKEEAEMAEALAYERDWAANAAKEVDAVPPKFVGRNTMFADPTGWTDFGSVARGSSVETPWYGDLGSAPGQIASLVPEMVNAAGQMLNTIPTGAVWGSEDGIPGLRDIPYVKGVFQRDHLEGPLPTTRTKTVETPMLSPLEYTGGKKPKVSVEYANRELLPRYLAAVKKGRNKDGRGLDVDEEDRLELLAIARLLENYDLPKNWQVYGDELGFASPQNRRPDHRMPDPRINPFLLPDLGAPARRVGGGAY